MMKRTAVLLMSALVMFAAGCEEGGESKETAAAAEPGSCQEGGPKGDTCSDYTKEGAADGKSYCEKTGGGKNVWTKDACRSEGRIGTCKRKNGQTQHYYEGGLLDADGAKEMCTTMSEGTWEAAKAGDKPAEEKPGQENKEEAPEEKTEG